MSPSKIVAILLLVAGALALAYGGFTYTDTHRAEVGPFKMSVKEKDFVNIPVWAGLAAMVAGAALLLLPTKR